MNTQTAQLETASAASADNTTAQQVDDLLSRLATENGIELKQALISNDPPKTRIESADSGAVAKSIDKSQELEDTVAKRLREIRTGMSSD